MSESKTEKKISFAEKTWEEIKDKKIEIFALPNQTVSMHCSPISVEPSKLYLNYKASSVVSALEQVMGSDYKVDFAAEGKYISISRK